MLKNIKKSIQIKKRSIIPHIFCLMIITLSMTLSGCYSSSSVEEETFEEKYEAAQKKYEKYLNGPVSGQEVLDLIDKWDETDFKMTVENIEDQRFRVSNLDKDDTIFKYWDKESCYYIDPDAFYEGSFILFEPPGRVYHISIGALNFSLVEDPTLSDDNTTDQND